MSVPFFRGNDRFDWLTLALFAWTNLHGDEQASHYLLDGLEPAEAEAFGSEEGIQPGFFIHIGAEFVIVGIEGTASTDPFSSQWQRNVLASVQRFNFPFVGLTHAGFAAAAGLFLHRFETIFTPYFATRRFVFTGHSAGGAIAQLLFQFFRARCTAGATCFVLGCPRVGDPAYAATLPDLMRLQTDLDLVTGLPPPLWASSLSFPVPGPPPLGIYQHAGTVQSLHQDGSWEAGDNTPTTDTVLSLLIRGEIGPHLLRAYAGGLHQGLQPQGRKDSGDGYADPSTVINTFNVFFHRGGGGPQEKLIMGKKITSFFSLNSKGFTDTYYTALTDPPTLAADLAKFIKARLALACPQVQWLYSRISDLTVKRQVDWATPAKFGIAPSGTYKAGVSQEDDALLLRGTCTPQANQMRIFLHGYPEFLVNNEVLNVVGSPWETKFLAFEALLVNNPTSYAFQSIDEVTPPVFQDITSVTPLPSRGFRVVPASPFTGVPGDTVYFRRCGHKGVGFSGRKIVTDVGAGGANFDVGGAVPVGDIDVMTAQFRILPIHYQPIKTLDVERYTAHRLGKVFGVRPGRSPSTLPLRR